MWPLRRIAQDNLAFRTSPDSGNLYMAFRPLLFFGDAGNGDQFALLAEVDRDDVFKWDHESDSRTWFASDVHQYLRWSIEGSPG